MKQLRNIIIILVSGLFFSYYVANAQSDIIKIDMTKGIEGDIPMSRLFKKVEYVRLETKEECLLDKWSSVYVTQKYIIATNVFEGVFVFDRKSGKFIHKINMPNEYYYGTQSFCEDNNLFLLCNFDYCKAVNIETDKTDFKIEYPKSESGKSYNIFPMLTFFNDSIFAININNDTGKVPYSLLLFDKKGKVLKAFPNNIKYELFGEHSFPTRVFYKYNNSLFFKNCQYNDTVFQITEEQMMPHIIFELGDKKPALPTKTQYVSGSEKKGGINVAVSSIGSWTVTIKDETDKYVFIYSNINGGLSAYNDRGVNAYYDKRSHLTYMTKTGSGNNGYINDIDYLPELHPITKNNNDEFAGFIDAKELLDYMKTHEKKKNWDKIKDISSLKENNNPIVVIAKLK